MSIYIKCTDFKTGYPSFICTVQVKESLKKYCFPTEEGTKKGEKTADLTHYHYSVEPDDLYLSWDPYRLVVPPLCESEWVEVPRLSSGIVES